jgi:L-amino acid N-acyltransferase YncA
MALSILERVMNTVDIRPVRPGDEDAIWALFQEVIASGDTFAFSSDTSRQQAQDIWMPPGNATYVAVVEGHVVGSYFVKPNQPGLGAHVCNAGYMVARDMRGRGLGRAMGEHSLVEARRLGYRAMQFNLVVTTNAHAVSLWKSLGFQVVGTLPEAFRHSVHGLVDALVMHRFL